MKENFELMECIYKDADMAYFAINKLSEDLKTKDNKIKGLVLDILDEYKMWKDKSLKCLNDNGVSNLGNSTIPKIMANMGIKKEVNSDNSDSSISKMLIEGISKGSIDMEKRIKSYDNDLDKSDIGIAKEFLKFQEKTIDKLKEYL